MNPSVYMLSSKIDISSARAAEDSKYPPTWTLLQQSFFLNAFNKGNSYNISQSWTPQLWRLPVVIIVNGVICLWLSHSPSSQTPPYQHSQKACHSPRICAGEFGIRSSTFLQSDSLQSHHLQSFMEIRMRSTHTSWGSQKSMMGIIRGMLLHCFPLWFVTFLGKHTAMWT